MYGVLTCQNCSIFATSNNSIANCQLLIANSDLLSKFSIFDVVNNFWSFFTSFSVVVICFQNFRSLMSWTTENQSNQISERLWFAFKIFDLWCREQLDMNFSSSTSGCDLLSKFSIFDVVNNLKKLNKDGFSVVICFQNFRSLMSWTTTVWKCKE